MTISWKRNKVQKKYCHVVDLSSETETNGSGYCVPFYLFRPRAVLRIRERVFTVYAMFECKVSFFVKYTG